MQDAPTPPLSRDTLIRAHAVDFVYRRHASVSWLLLFATAAFVAEAMQVFPQTAVLGWSGAMALALLARERLLVTYRRRSPPPEQARRWGRRFTFAAMAIGIMWGVGSTLFYTTDHPDYRVFLLVFIMGHALATIPLLAWWIEAYYAYVLPTYVPLMTLLIASGELHTVLLGLLAAPLLTLALILAHRIHASLRESIALRYENMELLEHLTVEKERAERAYRVNSRFLAAASHDLRQPLHALTLYLEPLAEELREPRHAELARKARISAHGVSELLNAILDLSRLDTGAAKPELRPVAIRELFGQLETELAPQFAEKGLRLRVRPIEGWLTTDPVYASRLLRNLLVNALRFTQRGGALLAARRRGDGIVVEVWDSGIGIPEEAIGRVFDEYVQLDNPERDREKGLGLGLAIVRRLAELLETPIDTHSRPGRGTRFRLRFTTSAPPRPSGPEASTAHGPRDLLGLRVVLIDDSREALDASAILLERWGCRVTAAASLEKAEERLDGEERLPDVVITDYRLRQGVTGIEVVGALRERYGATLPALIITGDTSGAEWERIRARGLPVLRKPLSPARLRAFLGRLERGRGT